MEKRNLEQEGYNQGFKDALSVFDRELMVPLLLALSTADINNILADRLNHEPGSLMYKLKEQYDNYQTALDSVDKMPKTWSDPPILPVTDLSGDGFWDAEH